MATPARTGLVLGRYRPLRPLGSGGSGSVWLARDEVGGFDVALKIVAREGKAAQRAEREAAAAAKIRHRACPRVHAIAHDTDHVYIAYEHVAGRTLREALRNGAVTDRAAVEVAAQLAEVLAHAHARGIVHRDVKPSNVLVADAPDVSIRLLDFGLARMDDADTLTEAGDVPGTLAYIAPERLAGDAATAKSDVWSVGVLLWEALAGEHPFWRPSLVESARAVEAGAPPLRELRPDLPRPLAAIVDRALSLDPAKRPSAERLARELRTPRRRRPQPARPRGGDWLGVLRGRLPTAAAAGSAAGLGAASLPFFPAGWPVGVAALAFAAALVRERLGFAVALAAPVFPLGNLSSGVALLYGLVAVAWFVLFAREPRGGLLPAAGPILALVGAVALLPLATVLVVRAWWRRALAAAAGLTLAALVAGVRGVGLPLTGDAPPSFLGLAGEDSATAAARTLVDAARAHAGLLSAGLVLAAAAVALPYARRRGPLWIAGWGSLVLVLALVPVRGVDPLSLVLAVWLTCALAWLEPALARAGARRGGS